MANHADSSWLILRYEPTSLFSLRMTHATNKGGKTLLVPTPYAVKLALIDACFRMYEGETAVAKARWVFDLIKGRQIRIGPPRDCVVQNTFIKIKQEERGAAKGIYAPTIAYREFCFYAGQLKIALAVDGLTDDEIDDLKKVAARVNYLGKRGSFMQFLGAEYHKGRLPKGYSCPESEADIVGGGYRATNYLDDFGEALVRDRDGFDRINTYSTKPSGLGTFRVLIPTLLPYRYSSSSKHYTHFRCVGS